MLNRAWFMCFHGEEEEEEERPVSTRAYREEPKKTAIFFFVERGDTVSFEKNADKI